MRNRIGARAPLLGTPENPFRVFRASSLHKTLTKAGTERELRSISTVC